MFDRSALVSTSLTRSIARKFLAVVAAGLLTACAIPYTRYQDQALPGAICAPRVYDRLYFGRDSEGRVITEAEWESFASRELTPVFPDGYTVLDASGQWRDAQGRIVREPTKIVEIVHDGHTERRAAIKLIVDRYKQAFKQEAVLLVETRSVTCY